MNGVEYTGVTMAEFTYNSSDGNRSQLNTLVTNSPNIASVRVKKPNSRSLNTLAAQGISLTTLGLPILDAPVQRVLEGYLINKC